ncbi:Tetratricopeptide repeat protein 4 [Stylophora pistillata]|uniref:Tetratricopeptide repeat protein 4 n=1 Tax=Stylophora pistillata TaxID=50429 RepID=A0A2B4RU60_STYPI|nr:Tetratricopeptide repeat protein 4 [Stylophora pistillata]
MADNKGPSTRKTAAELDEEIDEFMKERSSGKKREISFKEENWEEENMFKNQSFLARAEAYKEDGNYEYNRKKFKEAIAAYTEAIKVKCDDTHLNAILHTNRATAHLCLGATACVELQNFEDAVKWCDDGLAIEAQNQRLLDLRNKAVAEQKKVLRDQRKAVLKEKKEMSETEALKSAVKARGVTLEYENDLSRPMTDGGLDLKVSIDSSGVLHWPVMFVYPEFEETDLISSFNENDRMADHLYAMLEEESPPWDKDRKYTLANIEVYFEDSAREKLCLVKNSSFLKDILSDSSDVKLNDDTCIRYKVGSMCAVYPEIFRGDAEGFPIQVVE